MSTTIFPAPFLDGYIDTLIEVLGYSMVMASLIQGFKDEKNNLSLNELLETKRGISYEQSRLIYVGLQKMFLNNPAIDTLSFTKRIGKFWWFPSSPLTAQYWKQNSLYDLVGLPILKKLKTFQHNQSLSDKVQIALEVFAATLNSDANFDVHYHYKAQVHTIQLENSPFHEPDTHDCAIFYGIVAGLLEWLYGGNNNQVHNGLRHMFYIDDTSSLSNLVNIVIKI